MQFAREVNARSAELEENGALLVWVEFEDDARELVGSEVANDFFDDTIQTERGIRVGDLDTLPEPGMFQSSPLRTGVGYVFGVRRGDMGIAFSSDELSITPQEVVDAVIAAKNDPRTTAEFEGEKNFSACGGGPFQLGEACGCDDECLGAMVCDNSICTPTCSATDVSCDGGLVCALSQSGGICRSDEGGAPPSAICSRDDDCLEGLCNPNNDIGRTLCQVSCSADGDCEEGYACESGSCIVSGTLGKSCDEEGEGEEGCQQSSGGGVMALLLGLVFFRRFGVVYVTRSDED